MVLFEWKKQKVRERERMLKVDRVRNRERKGANLEEGEVNQHHHHQQQ